MARKRAQIALGLGLAMGVWLGLDQFAPDGSGSLSSALLRMSLLAFVAFGIGGFVARRDFLVPAILLALIVWVAVTAYSLSIGFRLGNPMWSQFVWNLPNLILIPAVAVGALVGAAAAKNVRGISGTQES